ncbi:saccharopine dehydrogenase-like oxidoreductase [Anaeramoeba flamelloides]|uniref:Saccharopine dehydrogenase-like oxidoreductase n=1 Tax=Anaeramoeba flamelloides TaxID=1746091 RepID=A0AAV7YC40_9EUKA|nr:saccharopine dehydrogenase-like oxidoreductase [Anaeramoeba flamelloides]KAJ6232167.1 saccharopine dehydrogenase-like oxidoreductase [Anaeramoeba flamelloides]
MTKREFDFIVFGTGYTGSLLAHHFVQEDLDFKWNIAGRNKLKCKSIAQELKELSNNRLDFKPVIADVTKPETIEEMCKKTRLIINCVGPFSKYGEVVVKTCIENKTHYLDINGEPQFINKMFVKYHEKAQENKVIIGLSAGFDSVPADVGVQLLKREMGEGSILKIGGFFRIKNLKMSNGTYKTLINSFNPSPQERKETREIRELSKKQNVPQVEYLDTKIKEKPKGYTTRVAGWSKNKEGLGGFAMKFSSSDPFIVKKTQILQDATKKIPSFRYEHYLMLMGWFEIITNFLKFFLISMLAKWGWGRKVLSWFESDLGGPNEKQRKGSYFNANFVGTNEEGKKFKYCLSGPDPYTSTAIFIKHTLSSVLLEYDDLEIKSGVITPGCLGKVYFNRILDDDLITWKNLEQKKIK